MKQTLKIGAVVLAVAALAMTGVALAQSDDEATTVTATAADDSPLRSRIIEWLAPLVEEGTIDQSQAEAVADRLEEVMPGPHGRMPGMRGLGRGLGAVREAADFLGMAPQDLIAAVRDGRTLAEVAAAAGSSGEALAEHLSDLAEQHLDEMVAAGRITADRAAEMLAHLSERLDDLVNGEIERPFQGGPGLGHGRGRGLGGFGGRPCTDDASDSLGWGA
ncbi:MAG: hypothetical protein FJW79_11300 [Actinobacteria bacterium]|nr:hypothetical protein [Actinomycetota bacterium]